MLRIYRDVQLWRSAIRLPRTLQLQIGENPVDHMNRDCALPDCGGYALHISRTNVSNREHSRQTCFQHLRCARKRPSGSAILLEYRFQIAAGDNKALLVQRNTPLQPVRSRGCSGHNEDMLDAVRLRLPGLLVLPLYPLQTFTALETNQLGIEMKIDFGILHQPSNQIPRHRGTELTGAYQQMNFARGFREKDRGLSGRIRSSDDNYLLAAAELRFDVSR